MKKIIIVRHAKSSWGDFGLSDFNRPLDARGLRDAPEMASKLKKQGHRLDKIISSDALRAKSTAKYFSEEFNVPLSEMHSLYHGEPDDYLNILASLDDQVDCVAMFGHNPGITEIANIIKAGCTTNIPTCGIIILEYNSKLWLGIDWFKMKMLGIMTPKGNGYAK